jgi:hypothetical protein
MAALTVCHTGAVNKRGVSWLLAVLMTLCASQAAPTVRARVSGEACAIVWFAGARQRAEQRVAVRPVGPSRPRSVSRVRIELPVRSRLFSNSLYQRPPPSTVS